MDNEENKKGNKTNKFNFVSMDELGKVSIDLNHSNDVVDDVSFENDKKSVVCSDDAFIDLKVSSRDIHSHSLYDTMAIEDIVSFESKETSSTLSSNNDDIENNNDNDYSTVSSSVDNDIYHFHYDDLEENSLFQEEDIEEDKNRIHDEFYQNEDRMEDKISEEKLIEDIENYYPDYSEMESQEEKKEEEIVSCFDNNSDFSQKTLENDESTVSLKPEKKIAKNDDTKKENIKDSNVIYSKFWRKIVSIFACILILCVGFIYFIQQAFYSVKENTVYYTENSDIRYSVCDKGVNGKVSCLSSDLDYFSSAIHSIKTTFDYDITFDTNVDQSFSYRIVAATQIRDVSNPNNILYSNEEDLFKKSFRVDDDGIIAFNTTVDVNFEKYNQNVLNYMTQYNLNVESDLNVILYIDNGDNERVVASIQLPLNSKTFRVKKNLSNNVEKSLQVKGFMWDFSNNYYLIISIVLLCIILFLLYRMVRLFVVVRSNRNKYQVHLTSLLREYDRLIVIARNGYESNVTKEIVFVNTFDDLLKIRRDLEKPIIFSKISDLKCEFIVEDDEKLYKYILKEADL